MTDYYAALGVPKTATADEIKRAFVSWPASTIQTKVVTHKSFKPFKKPMPPWVTNKNVLSMTIPDHSFQDFGRHPGGVNINDIFGQMFGQQFAQQQQHPRRSHVRMTLWISLLDVATGGKRTVSLGTQAGVSAVEIEIPLGIGDGDNVQYEGIGPGGQILWCNLESHLIANGNVMD
jgi:hypothetical protein